MCDSRVCDFEMCKKKLSLVDTTIICGCQGCFCMKHRNALAHNCTVDYRAKFIEQQKAQSNTKSKMPKCELYSRDRGSVY